MYLCPSSPLDPVASYQPNPGYNRYAASYVGIPGSARDFLGFTETRRQGNGSSGAGCCDTGWVAGGGVLIPLGQVKIAAISDGTSNTLVVSEITDYYTTTDGVKRDWRPSQAGLTMGTESANGVPNFVGRTFNCTAVLYGINRKTGWPVGGSGLGDCTTGVCGWPGGSNPLASPHTGGVNGLLADGSVRFLTDATAIDTLSALAVRDDGQVVTLP